MIGGIEFCGDSDRLHTVLTHLFMQRRTAFDLFSAVQVLQIFPEFFIFCFRFHNSDFTFPFVFDFFRFHIFDTRYLRELPAFPLSNEIIAGVRSVIKYLYMIEIHASGVCQYICCGVFTSSPSRHRGQRIP